jgi:hypothetical protein
MRPATTPGKPPLDEISILCYKGPVVASIALPGARKARPETKRTQDIVCFQWVDVSTR